jgi:cysteine desulfurase
MKIPIYLDNHATTPVDPRVLEAMLPYFQGSFGNAASRSHIFGWEAEAAVDEAREKIAQFLGAESPQDVVFTSGATESDNLAILGVARANRDRGDHIVTCATEHNAVLDSCRALEREGFQVTRLEPLSNGQVEPAQVWAAVTDRTILVTLMLANNEIGTVHRMEEIGAVCAEKGVLFHSDAVQGVGKVAFHVKDFHVDLASLTAHKIYGPKGAGALYARSKSPRIRLSPLFHGGGHERGLRPGTLNVPGIVGLGKACEIAGAEMASEAPRLRRLRRRLCDGIRDRLDGVQVNGYALPRIDAAGELLEPEWRLPGNLNLSFERAEGEALLMGLKDLAVSSGAACTSASIEPSHVLRAVGVPDALAYSSVRFGLGRFNTEEEIDHAAEEVVRTVRRLREQTPA